MEAPNGSAPVYLHDLLHKLQTSIGTRPKVDRRKNDPTALTPVAVGVWLCADTPLGDAARTVSLEPTDWRFVPHLDKLVFNVSLPPGWKLIHEDDGVSVIANAVNLPQPEPEPGAVHTERLPDAADIPEFANVNPDVFKVNTDKPAGSWGKEHIPNSGG